jgi:hypothetical protein
LKKEKYIYRDKLREDIYIIYIYIYMGGGGSCSLSFKVLLAAVATVMLVLLLLVGALESGATKMTERTQTVLDSIAQDDLRRRHEELIGREKLVYNPELDLNFVMNKRKVPNGPDPIHNRCTIIYSSCFAEITFLIN